MDPNDPPGPSEKPGPEYAHRTRLFSPRTWDELFALPGMSRNPIPRTKMVNGALVGDYEMEPKSGLRPCGIAECHTDHRHGFVVALGDDVLGYIGRHCGRSQFGAEWAKMKSTFRKQKREQSKAQALEELRGELGRKLDDWRTLENDETVWARCVLQAFDALPRSLRDTIENRADAGDAAVPGYRLETKAEVERRAFLQNWKQKSLPPARNITYERGPLLGLASLRRAGRVDALIDVTVPALHKQARQLIESASANPDDFGKMMKRLDDIVKQVDSSIRKLQAFVSPSNLGLLPHLRPFEQAGVVSVHFDAELPRFVVSFGAK